MAQYVMPYVYMVLWPGLLTTLALMCVYWRHGWSIPKHAVMAIGAVLALEAVPIFMLSLMTGDNPVFSLATYRPVVVSLRGTMLVFVAVADYLLVAGIVRMRRALGAVK